MSIWAYRAIETADRLHRHTAEGVTERAEGGEKPRVMPREEIRDPPSRRASPLDGDSKGDLPHAHDERSR